MRRIIGLSILFAAVIGVFAWLEPANAGFGISPPYVKTAKPIFPGSHYEQKIILLRSSADADMVAQLSIDAPEIYNWISFNGGDTIDLPQGELQVPLLVNVNVPSDAEIGDYKGHINVRIVPKAAAEAGGVAIALGARIEIDLAVTKQSFFDFNIRKVAVPSIETLGWPWRWPIFSWWLYRVDVVMDVENTGNVKAAPSRVNLEIYDLAERRMLESGDVRRLKKIPPFSRGDITASFPTKLEPGQYWARIKIYKDKEIIQNRKLVLTVVPHGQLEDGSKLGLKPWLMLLVLLGLIVLSSYLFIRFRAWRYIGRLLWLLLWPLRHLLRRFWIILGRLNVKFWRWLHKKTARYQDDPPRRQPRR